MTHFLVFARYQIKSKHFTIILPDEGRSEYLLQIVNISQTLKTVVNKPLVQKNNLDTLLMSSYQTSRFLSEIVEKAVFPTT